MSTTDVSNSQTRTTSSPNATLAQQSGGPDRRVPLLAAALAADLNPGGRRASLIVDRLYLSNFATATNRAQLETLGITHIVSALDFSPKTSFPSHIKRLHVHLSDVSSANILNHLDETTEFIKTALAENETNIVLVHCLMGISRSATVVCAYLIATTSMDSDEALDFVMRKRSVVCPNLGFRLQLETYAARFSKKAVQTKKAGNMILRSRKAVQ